MTHYTATLSTSGNGFVLRIPKRIVEESGLKPGDKVIGPDLKALPAENEPDQKRQAFIAAVEELQRVVAENPDSGLGSIKDPVAWQREIRQDRPLPGRE